MTSCEHCTKASTSRWHGGYQMHCAGCRARACARSLAAFHALDAKGSGDKEPLRAMVRRLLPGMPEIDARRAVRDWWLRDREHIEIE